MSLLLQWGSNSCWSSGYSSRWHFLYILCWLWLRLGLPRSSGTITFLSTSPGPLLNEQTHPVSGVQQAQQYPWAGFAIKLAEELTACGSKWSEKVCVTLFRLYHSSVMLSKIEERQNQVISCGIPTEDQIETPSLRLRNWWASVYKLGILQPA